MGTERERGSEALEDGSRSLAAQIFGGDGEMARLLREHDWSSSPLGPMDTWPQSLLTALSICVRSKFPTVIYWGPNIATFYNDGYAPILGAKHPWAIGRPLQEVWAEIWDAIRGMIDEVMTTGVATWSEDQVLYMRRKGYLEECYFTWSFAPVVVESGHTGGLYVAVTETTPRVLADRRMKALRQMVVDARTVRDAARQCVDVLVRDARDVPFAMVYLLDDDARTLRLAAQAGIDPGTQASPLAADLVVTGGAPWPLARVALEGKPEVVGDLAARFDCLPLAPWGEPSGEAMVLPIPRPMSRRVADRVTKKPTWKLPAGVLVLGANPRRAIDDDYRGFFELACGNVATALAGARAYEEETERVAELTALDHAKTAFFSNVSHEFRTPLTLILGPVEDALRDAGKGLRGAELAAVHRSAVRLLKLVNSLLDFSRIEASRFQARFEPVDIATLTGGLAGSFQSLVESAGLRLVVDCPPLGEPAWIDRGQWEKIVLNLVSNAFKYTFQGSITVRLRTADTNIELTVADTGTGIPRAELGRIFERFHRVEGAHGRSFEGTGIGLALVDELVKQHGGAVRVESEVGEGSTFVVTVPRGKDHLPQDRIAAASDAGLEITGAEAYLREAEQWVGKPPEPLESAPAEPVSPAPVPFGRTAHARILVADDNADMREYLARLLRTRWTVDLAQDGREALELAIAQPPDLVLSDVMMPRMDGVSLVKALRGTNTTSMIPVILLSARAGEEAVVGGLETGADDYLAKPFSARELISRVGTHLEMATLRKRATEAATELADTRAVLLDDLAHKNRELEAFSYSVSHDLRAPLRSINGFSHALLEDHGPELSPAARADLEQVLAATVRMGEIIEDLLTLSRVDRSELRREPVDLSRLGRHVWGALATPDREVAFTVEEGLTADADHRLVGVVLENLLGNAWKFTSGTAAAKVELGSLQRGPETVYYVKDNGAGFDPAYAGRLFVPFHRLHSDAEFGGTGIGLATVRRIVERHGGRAWAEGQVGHGATIYFTLPPPRRHPPSLLDVRIR